MLSQHYDIQGVMKTSTFSTPDLNFGIGWQGASKESTELSRYKQNRKGFIVCLTAPFLAPHSFLLTGLGKDL
jgi:hypothetical protein